jgi:arsenate reductase-like glutaredoxin family protein
VVRMATTTSAKAARKAARESALAANADLVRRTKLNVEDLTKFFASMSRADGVNEWLNEEVEALKELAAKRRDTERRQAGVALAAMRERGEQVRDIARLARINERQVRELIRLAEAVGEADADAPEVADPASGPDPRDPGGPRATGDAHAASTSNEGANLVAVGQ